MSYTRLFDVSTNKKWCPMVIFDIEYYPNWSHCIWRRLFNVFNNRKWSHCIYLTSIENIYLTSMLREAAVFLNFESLIMINWGRGASIGQNIYSIPNDRTSWFIQSRQNDVWLGFASSGITLSRWNKSWCPMIWYGINV